MRHGAGVRAARGSLPVTALFDFPPDAPTLLGGDDAGKRGHLTHRSRLIIVTPQKSDGRGHVAKHACPSGPILRMETEAIETFTSLFDERRIRFDPLRNQSMERQAASFSECMKAHDSF